MAAFDDSPMIDLGRNPIPGTDPCGSDVGDDEEYIFALGEVAKLDRIEADEPDWRGIERAAVSILKSKSKDVAVASTLGLALFKQHGYAGLAAWMGLVTELVNTSWDGLFPARSKRRRARIETVTDRFVDGGWFGENRPKDDSFDALDLCAERIAKLEAALTARMPDDPPDFKKFVRVLKEYCAKRPPAAATAPTGVAPADAGASVSVDAAVPAREVTDRGGAIRAALEAATFLRKADLSDPVPYALVRAIRWSRIAIPASDAAGHGIDPPDASLIETLEHQFAKELWENLLKNAEAAFRTADPLWLDLQRWVCSAMRGLGAGFDNAHETVVGATGALVNRLGDALNELTFRGGRPLCSGETRMWVESEVAVAAGPAGREATAGTNGRLDEASDKARKLASSGKIKEGLAVLQGGLAGCTQRRERFLWRLRMAQLCFDSQRLQLAGPLLEECFEEIQRFRVDEWEPPLAVGVAQTLYRCRKSLASGQKSPSSESLDKVRDSFAWLCQLDPVAALAAESSGT